MMSITEIAKYFGLTRQGVYVALKDGKFPSIKQFNTRWKINFEDYLKYHNRRYDRKNCKKEDGTPLFDKEQGIYSVVEAAEYLNCNPQWLYYRLRNRMLPAKRYRAAWLIHVDDLNKMKETLDKNKSA